MSRILVTGAASGLGELTARTLAGDEHEVVVHARNADRFQESPLLYEMDGAIYGDLSDLDDTIALAERANDRGRFDAVIHNAGVMRDDATLQVNVVAPYVLTALMERPGRIVVVSSSMHTGGDMELDGDRFPRDAISYSTSKLYVTAFALGLARRWPDVMAHALCPGWVATRMGGESAPDDITEGHLTQEWLATAPEYEIEPRTGGYWHHQRHARLHPAAADPEYQDAIIRALELETGIALPE